MYQKLSCKNRGLLSPIQTVERRKADPRDPEPSAARLGPRGFSTGVVDSLGEGFVLHTSYRGYGCPQCAGVTASSEYNIGRSRPDLASEWNYNRNKIKPEDHTPNSGKKVWWRCALGHEWKAAIDHRNRKGRGIRSGFRSSSP